MKLYLITAKISDVLEEGSLVESTTVNAEDIGDALRQGASILGVTYDMILSVSVVRGV